MNCLKQILLQTYKESLSALGYVFISLISSGRKEDNMNKGKYEKKGGYDNQYNQNNKDEEKRKKQEEFDVELFLKYATDKEKKRYRAMW